MVARLSRPVSLRSLKGEETMEIKASAEERAALAEALDVMAIERLVAGVSLKPWRSTGVRVWGEVEGEVTQECVVTLEPVTSAIHETFDVRLHPDARPAATVDVDPEAEDPPEPLEGDKIDVGALALEYFALGIDPYPRAPGVEFVAEDDAVADEPSPFAALEALRKSMS